MPHAADRPARLERLALCDLALAVGPAAPTLCHPWTVADLLAHLVLRERRPDLAAGIVLPALADVTERGQDEIAAWDFERLVETVRAGAPPWNPTSIGRVDDAVNLVEMFVHHEDIRRANDLAPRTDTDPAVARAVAGALRRLAPILFRRAVTGVRLEPTGRRPIEARRPAAGHGTVTLSGDAAELLLYGYGRAGVAAVVADGDPHDVRALVRTPLGLL